MTSIGTAIGQAIPNQSNSTATSLIRLLNASQLLPYRIILERPGSLMSSTCIEYMFKCTASENTRTVIPSFHDTKDVNDTGSSSQLATQYDCELTLRKIPLEKAGMQYTQDEFVMTHHMTLVRMTETEWVLYCKRLNEVTILDPPIVLPCLFNPRSRKWRIQGTYRQINSLFTLNVFGEGLGLWANLVCDQHVVELHADQPDLELYSLGYGKKVAYSRIYDGYDDTGVTKVSNQTSQDVFQKWRSLVYSMGAPS